MDAIVQELHTGERKQIEQRKQDFILQINSEIKESKSLEEKVKLLCNVTGRFFVMRRDWPMANSINLETVEAVITAHWKEIKAEVVIDLRKSMLDRCIVDADKATICSFYSYADQILPL
jgi:hypothetical protein